MELKRLKNLIQEGMSNWQPPLRPPLVRGPNYPDKHLNEPLDNEDITGLLVQLTNVDVLNQIHASLGAVRSPPASPVLTTPEGSTRRM